jgi:ADP-glucose pyrophosphorylase
MVEPVRSARIDRLTKLSARPVVPFGGTGLLIR